MRLGKYKGRWCAIWNDNGTKRASLRTTDRVIAEQRFADFIKQFNAPGDTIADFMQAYIADKRASGFNVERFEFAWQRLQPTFGNLLPEHVNRALCRKYAANRCAAPGTIRKEITLVGTAIRAIRKDADFQIELPPPPPPRERHLSREEYDRLVESARITPHVYLFVILALATAARATALLELSWNRVDLDRRIIRLGSGNRLKGRATVPITERALVALKEARECALTPFVIEYGGKRVKRIRKGFARAVARAAMPTTGPDKVSPHTLRHTAAVWMAEAGTSMTEIAKYLGHSDERTTYRVYIHFSPDFLRKASAALEG